MPSLLFILDPSRPLVALVLICLWSLAVFIKFFAQVQGRRDYPFLYASVKAVGALVIYGLPILIMVYLLNAWLSSSNWRFLAIGLGVYLYSQTIGLILWLIFNDKIFKESP